MQERTERSARQKSTPARQFSFSFIEPHSLFSHFSDKAAAAEGDNAAEDAGEGAKAEAPAIQPGCILAISGLAEGTIREDIKVRCCILC